MPKPKLTYAIDDALSTDDNLAALKTAIEAIDTDLAAILSPQLSALSAGETVDTGAIWNALLAATAVPGDDAVGNQA